MSSGLAGVLIPVKVGAALHLDARDARGSAEIRAGLGGTYAALGGWALLSRNPLAHRAVGVAWLGAAVARLASLRVEPPETDSEFWAYLAAELALGTAGVTARQRPPQESRARP
jgi:hypothetical protein